MKKLRREFSSSDAGQLKKLQYEVAGSREDVVEDEEFELERQAMERSAKEVARKRVGKTRARWDEGRLSGVSVESGEEKTKDEESGVDAEAASELSFWQLVKVVYPTLPNKPLVFFGMFISVLSGAMTPLFSFQIGRAHV